MNVSPLSASPILTIDQRGSPRVVAAYRARIRLGPQTFADCRTYDIGRGGVGLWSPEPLAPGRTVQLALQLPDTHRGGPCQVAMASATVVFQILAGTQFRVGLQWVTPHTPALDALAHWLQRRTA